MKKCAHCGYPLTPDGLCEPCRDTFAEPKPVPAARPAMRYGLAPPGRFPPNRRVDPPAPIVAPSAASPVLVWVVEGPNEVHEFPDRGGAVDVEKVAREFARRIGAAPPKRKYVHR